MRCTVSTIAEPSRRDRIATELFSGMNPAPSRGPVLGELLDEEFRHLETVPQVLLRNLIRDVDQLTAEQQRDIRYRASVDFVVYRRVSRVPVLAIEVDGFAFHENSLRQRERDAIKDDIFARSGLRLLRLPTTGSREQDQIRRALESEG